MQSSILEASTDGIMLSSSRTELWSEVVMNKVMSLNGAEATADHDEVNHTAALLQALLAIPSGISIIATDANFRIRYFNQGASTIFGYSHEQMIEKDLLEMHRAIGMDHRLIQKAIAAASKHGEYRFAQHVISFPNTCHLDSILVLLRAAGNKLCGYALLSRDISETVLAEDAQRTLARAVEQSSVSIVITDCDGIIEYVNPRFTETTGYTITEVLRIKAGVQRSGETSAEVYHDLWSTITKGDEWTGILRNRRKNGEPYWDMVRILPVQDTTGRITHFVSLQEDITERKENEERLRLWATVFANSSEAIMITDANSRILSVNNAFVRISGYMAEEVVGNTPKMLASGRHDAEFFRQMWQDLQVINRWEGEIWDRRKNGDIYPKWLEINKVRNNKGETTHYVGIFSDITERKAAQKEIEYLAHHDSLTGLPNRVLLGDRLNRMMARAKRHKTHIALLFLDIDHFKTINDSLGHPIGDKLLQAVTARIQKCVRQMDTISRHGGDEFVVALDDISTPVSAEIVARKILEATRTPFLIGNQTLHATLSIGISFYPDDGSDLDTLLKHADTAMYHAKDAGRNTFCLFTDSMNAMAQERLLIHNQIHGAVGRDEFFLHYQPQIDCNSGSIIGVEALLRWNNPTLGLVSPSRFIPIIESSGEIINIGGWVLHQACRQAQAWHKDGMNNLRIAVNISALQLLHVDFLNLIESALSETYIDPALLELEITESTLIQDVESTLEAVHHLKKAGVKIAIDDFGTGYSSLAYLKRFAVDRLKIDRSFIQDIPSSTDDAIIRAIIQMAKSLRIPTLTEGVETREQYDYLRNVGCDELQGFFCSKPLPAEEFARYYLKYSKSGTKPRFPNN